VKLPWSEKGYWTFGSFNQVSKLNERVLQLWGQLLEAVPRSKLRIAALADKYVEKKMQHYLRSMGITDDRVDFFGTYAPEDYYASYAEVDIVLDSFPYNGGTTSCDALLLGVPVAAIAGNRSISRGGVSLLRNLGMDDWIADSEESFVEMIQRQIAEPQRIALLRAELPARMRASPLMDGPRFARNVERVFRQAWRKYCEIR
jgi:predicted O-linked N-acetylglucosamine transferase (SPINDLY family)